MIQQAMELDRPLRPSELRPVRRAQVDHRRVQAHQLVLEPERPPTPRQGLTASEERLEHGPIELPRAMGVGIGQRRAGRRRDAQVFELALTAAQPAADLSQGMGTAELAEEHGDELPPAREPAGMALGVRPRHQRLELRPRKQLEELAEHAAESTHG